MMNPRLVVTYSATGTRITRSTSYSTKYQKLRLVVPCIKCCCAGRTMQACLSNSSCQTLRTSWTQGNWSARSVHLFNSLAFLPDKKSTIKACRKFLASKELPTVIFLKGEANNSWFCFRTSCKYWTSISMIQRRPYPRKAWHEDVFCNSCAFQIRMHSQRVAEHLWKLICAHLILQSFSIDQKHVLLQWLFLFGRLARHPFDQFRAEFIRTATKP